MEPPETTLDEYLATLDPESRERVIQRESLWHLQDPRMTPLPDPEPPRRKPGRRRYRRVHIR